MDDSYRGILYILGIIAAAYLSIKYILPFLLKALGILLSAVLWICIAVMAVYLVLYIVRILNER